jgi:hypothetical protein
MIMLIAVATVSAKRPENLPPAEPDGECDGVPFGHQEMWTCALRVADEHFAGNGDGQLSAHELRVAFDHFLSWWKKGIFRVAMGVLEDHVEDCTELPGQDVTYASFVKYKDACFPKQDQRCKVKRNLCDPAALELKIAVY